MAIEYDKNLFEVQDLYDIYTADYEKYCEEYENKQKYGGDYGEEDLDDLETPDEYRQKLFGDLKSGEEYVLTQYTGDDEEVVIPEGIASIKASTFANRTKLRAVRLPESLLRIANGAFRGCASLERVEIKDKLRLVANDAFGGCSSLSSISFPSGLELLGARVFKDCVSLKSVQLGDSLAGIGREAFCGCSALEKIVIPDSATVISINAFEGCASLREVNMGNNIEAIGWNAFENCKSLKTIELSEALKDVDQDVFRHSGLESIVIPKNVRYISSEAFSFCDSLQSIEVVPENLHYLSYDNCIYTKDNTLIPKEGIFVYRNDHKDYDSLVVGANDGKIVDNGQVYHIMSDSFKGNSKVGKVDMPDSIKSLGIAAYMDCVNLKEVAFSKNISEIPRCAFDGCVSLEEIVIPGHIKRIDDNAFFGCGLKKAVVKRGAEYIGGAFCACKSLREVYLPASLQKVLVWSIFSNCDKSLRIYIEDTQDERFKQWADEWKSAGFEVIQGCDPSIFD